MKSWLRLSFAGAVLALLAGCAGTPLKDVEGLACEGIVQPVNGLREISDAAVVDSARAPAGQGKLCDGKAYLVQGKITVYRVWDSSRPWSEFGTWWSFDQPTLSRDDYRKRYAICPSWSRLDRVTVCTVQRDSKVVVGPGQSVTCDPDPPFPKSAATQVFMDGLSVRLQACASAQWPQAAGP